MTKPDYIYLQKGEVVTKLTDASKKEYDEFLKDNSPNYFKYVREYLESQHGKGTCVLVITQEDGSKIIQPYNPPT